MDASPPAVPADARPRPRLIGISRPIPTRMKPPQTLRVVAALASLLPAAAVRADDPPVSFTHDVAPLLVEQCLACHNARTVKGRFSLQSFQSLLKGGESGPAIAPGASEDSTLVQLLEAGEMPKEGDPLSAVRIETLKRWIDQGAKLDDGRPSEASLTSLIPRPAQPLPPDRYPAPLPVTALALRSDGSLLAASGYHETLLFDPADGRLHGRIQDLAERVYGLDFSPDGTLLAVAAGTPARLGEVRIFRAESGEIVHDLAVAGDAFFDAAFSPDGSKIAAAGADRTVRVWEVAGGAELRRIEDHADWVTAVAFSPDGTRLATASRDKTAKVFDVATGECLSTFTGHGQPVTDIAFCPTRNDRLVTSGRDRRVRCWTIAEAKQEWERDFKCEIVRLAVIRVAGEPAVVAAGTDGSVRICNPELDAWKDRPSCGDWVQSVAGAAASDAGLFAVGSQDGSITIYDAEQDGARNTFPAMPPE